MFISCTSHDSNNHLVPQDLTRNPSSSSSTLKTLPFPDANDQIHQFDSCDHHIDNYLLDYDLLPLIDPPSYQNTSYSNSTTYFDNELTPILDESTKKTTRSSCSSIDMMNVPPPNNLLMDVGIDREMVRAGSRIALRMKTDCEIVDDGYRWRKYGKKKVLSSPNPRNYYRCWVVGCNVKKRVERDKDDSSYVITTYDGVHNHTPITSAYPGEHPFN